MDIEVSGFATKSVNRVADRDSNRIDKFTNYYYNADQLLLIGEDDAQDAAYSTAVELEDLNNAAFYTEIMGLDAAKWELAALDIQRKQIARVKVFRA